MPLNSISNCTTLPRLYFRTISILYFVASGSFFSMKAFGTFSSLAKLCFSMSATVMQTSAEVFEVVGQAAEERHEVVNYAEKLLGVAVNQLKNLLHHDQVFS